MRPFMQYVVVKYRDKMQWKNYVADCLWAPATGHLLKKEDESYVYPRWHEVVNPKKEVKGPEVTKDDVKAKFIRLKTK